MVKPIFSTCAVLALGLSAVAADAQVTSASKPARDVGDAASTPVGMTSASTVGSFTTGAFVQNAARSDMYEIQAGELAVRKSGSPAIKTFARQMIRDHNKTTATLKSTIASANIKVDLPTDLDQRRKGMLENLSASSGAEFDKRYVDQQRAAHQEALTLLKGFAAHGDNATLRRVAAKTAPMVEHHLAEAKALPG